MEITPLHSSLGHKLIFCLKANENPLSTFSCSPYMTTLQHPTVLGTPFFILEAFLRNSDEADAGDHLSGTLGKGSCTGSEVGFNRL